MGLPVPNSCLSIVEESMSFVYANLNITRNRIRYRIRFFLHFPDQNIRLLGNVRNQNLHIFPCCSVNSALAMDYYVKDGNEIK